MSHIAKYKERILAGGEISADEAMGLATLSEAERNDLYGAAAEITARFMPRKFDSCSIINARSGRCPEDCKWCAQSSRWPTEVDIYPLVDREVCLSMAARNRLNGIGRYSLVASGRTVTGEALDRVCSYYEALSREGGLGLCASLGLLDGEALGRLRKAGVSRYHCNLETAGSFFPSLCTTHTQQQKLTTLELAREAGMDVCSGGIIGMGESAAQRIELALDLRRVNPVSIPLNVLMPIPGTPLEGRGPLTADELLDTVAIFRLVHPHATLRFAGGRLRIPREVQLRALRIGINGAIIGDMLTTAGPVIERDKALVKEGGYEF